MRMKAGRIMSALLATTALGVGAVELDANFAARNGLREILADHPGLSVRSVFAEPLTGHLFLQRIDVAAGTARISIGALDLPIQGRGLSIIGSAQASPFDDKNDDAKPDSGGGGGDLPAAPETPAEPSGGGPASDAPAAAAPAGPAPVAPAPAPSAPATTTAAVPGTTTADNIVITRGTTSYRIKHIELAGSPLSNADLAAILDPKSTETIEARLRRLTATAVTVPEIDIDNTADATETHVVLSRIVLAGATAGKVVSGTIDTTTFNEKATAADPDGKKTTEWSTGPIVATAIDFGQIARLFEAKRTDEAEPVLPLYDSVTVTNFKSGKPGKTFTVAAIKETGAKARALQDGMFPKDGEPEQTKAQNAARYADFIRSVAIGSIALQDMAGGDADTKFSLANIGMKDFADGKLGGLSVGALTIDGPKTKVSLGSIEVGPLTLPPSSAIEKGPVAGATTQMIPADIQIAVDKVTYDVDMADAAKNEPSQRVAFNLAHFALAGKGKSGELPASSTMTIGNLSFDVPPTGSGKPLLDMGYRHVDLSLDSSTVYDAEAQTLLVKNLSLQGVDMGSIALSVGLINVTKGVTSPDPEVAKGSALAILVKSIALDVVNKGLAEKALARQAAADGISVDKERENLVDLVAVRLPASVNNNANAKLIGSALGKFIADPKSLHIVIVSKNGLGAASMGMLGDPGLLLDTLDVKATANQ